MFDTSRQSKVNPKDDFYGFRVDNDHANGLPAVKTQPRFKKQKDTQINAILKGLIKERMVGSLINYDMLRKSEEVRKKDRSDFSLDQINQTISISRSRDLNAKSRCFNHDKERSLDRGSNQGHFITRVDPSKQASSVASRLERLPTLSLPPIHVSSPDKSLWKSISVGNRLKKQLFLKLLNNKFGQYVTSKIVRFFQPPYDGVFFKYRDFVDNVVKCPNEVINLLMFQIFDEDADGVISCQDLFKVHQLIQDAELKPMLQNIIYELQRLISEYGTKPGVCKGQSLLEYLSRNHTLTFNVILSTLSEQHKPFLESSIKKFTGYERTFLVTEHNEQIRQQKQRAEQIKYNLQMEVTRKKEGLTYTSYAASMPEIALMREVVAVLQGGAKFIDSQ